MKKNKFQSKRKKPVNFDDISKFQKNMSRFLTIRQVCLYTNYSRQTIILQIYTGELKAHSLPNGHYRVEVGELIKFLEKNKIPLPDEMDNFKNQTKQTKVLIAEDEKITAKVYKYYLEEAGFEVMNAFSGAEALNKIYKFHPDILILDILMRNQSGWEILKELNKGNFLNNMKVIVVTGLEEKEIIDQLRRGGLGDFETSHSFKRV